MKKHLFARICRVMGRFLLCIGVVFLTGSILLVAAPTLFGISKGSTANQLSVGVLLNPGSSCGGSVEPVDNFALSAVSAGASILLLIVFAIVLRRYNDTIRKAIALIAKKLRLNIHTTELLCTTLVWAIVTLVTIFYAPVFSLFAIATLIANNLFFIFAWTSYGCPNYTL